MKTFLYIVLAAAVTLGAIVYQRSTGPTYPRKVELAMEGTTYSFSLIRSHGGKSDCRMTFDIPDPDVEGRIIFRRFPTADNWTITDMVREDGKLAAYLPHQPPAGKLEYKVEFMKNDKVYPLHESYTTVIRFKGDVPAMILIPHIILMFVAMFLSNLTGILALFRYGNFRKLAAWTLALLGLGGMILGPWVQWHAFGEAWAGIPFAWDLTDNKTLIAFLFWILAVVKNRKTERPAYILAASIVMLIIYAIPHSMYGSELDPESGRIIQGMILLF